MRYENVSCSSCGRDFGPGEHGFSHCDSHIVIKDPQRVAIMALQRIVDELPKDDWASNVAGLALSLIGEHHPQLVQ